jgi:hypothetical protein
VEPTGLGTIAPLMLAGTALQSFTLARLSLAIGARVAMDLPAHRLHLFDADGVRVGH